MLLDALVGTAVLQMARVRVALCVGHPVQALVRAAHLLLALWHLAVAVRRLEALHVPPVRRVDVVLDLLVVPRGHDVPGGEAVRGVKMPDVVRKVEVLLLLAQLSPTVVGGRKKTKGMFLRSVHQPLPPPRAVLGFFGSSVDSLEVIRK